MVHILFYFNKYPTVINPTASLMIFNKITNATPLKIKDNLTLFLIFYLLHTSHRDNLFPQRFREYMF